MNLEYVFHLVDEFGVAMRDQAKNIASDNKATAMALNQQRDRLRDAIRKLAEGQSAEEVAAERVADTAIASAAAPTLPSKTTLTNGSPVTADHREIDPATGMQKAYVVLSAEERAKGFVRPVRTSYVHDECGTVTTMGQALAETYARDPAFYSGTFCVGCRAHFPVGADGKFFWQGTVEKVGT